MAICSWTLALFGLWLSAFPLGAATVNFEFDASLQTGNLAGINFIGAAAYNDQGSTGKGAEFLSLTSLNFTVLGFPFTLADVDQGGQVILENVVPSDFLAAFFPADSASPVTALAFGFGGPGIIGYTTTPGSNFGDGVYGIATIAVPEPYLWPFSGFRACSVRSRSGDVSTRPPIIPESGIPWMDPWCQTIPKDPPFSEELSYCEEFSPRPS